MASSASTPDHAPPSAAYPPPHVWETMSADERRTWLQQVQALVASSMERGTKRQRSDTSAADEDETVHAAHVSGRGVHLQFGSRRPPPKEGHLGERMGP